MPTKGREMFLVAEKEMRSAKRGGEWEGRKAEERKEGRGGSACLGSRVNYKRMVTTVAV